MLSSETRQSEKAWIKENENLLNSEEKLKKLSISLEKKKKEETRLFQIFKTDAEIDGVLIENNTDPKKTLIHKGRFSEFTLRSRFKWKEEWNLLHNVQTLHQKAFFQKHEIQKEEQKKFQIYLENLKKDGLTFEQRDKERTALKAILSALPN